MARPFNNAITALHKSDGGLTGTYTLVPTTKIDGNPSITIDKYASTGDVANGQAYEGVAFGGVGQDIEIECIMLSDGATSPAIVSNVKAIADCENLPAYMSFAIKRADGTGTHAEYLVNNVKVYQGETGKGAARVTATLTRNGASASHTFS